MRYDERDMNGDGKVDERDIALFHSMLDEELKGEPQVRLGSGSGGSSKEEILAGRIAKGVILVPLGGYLWLLFGGVLPMNEFTALLALFCAAGILGTLLR